MRISIAMTSYNSERFVGEQLDSLANQARKPDELVVCDDQSTDRTPEILREFARNSPFSVRVVGNKSRLGVTRNFDQAVQLCTGDLIFISDHDDCWSPDKLAKHESIHRSDPEVGFVFSNSEICDEQLNSRGFTQFDAQGLGAARLAAIPHGKLFDLCIRSPRVPGCTMSFSSPLRDVLLPTPTSALYDVWFSLLLSAFTRTRCIEKALMRYRTHASQACGLYFDAKAEDRSDPDLLSDMLKSVENSTSYFQDALQRVRAYERRLYRKDAAKLLEQKLAHLEARSKIGGSRLMRFARLAGEMLNGRYLRYSTKGDVISDVKLCWSAGRAGKGLRRPLKPRHRPATS